ncbi:MAG: hypothetical protein LBS79_09215 [Tannerella sp.]|nr:hypothetical protein [Tannerella sp.]
MKFFKNIADYRQNLVINVFGIYAASPVQHNYKLMAGYNREKKTYKTVKGSGQE